MKINPNMPAVTRPPSPSKPEVSGDFGQLLMDVIKEVSANQQQARTAQNELLTGQPVEAHDVLIALEKASIGMQLTLQVRNKLLEAYQEINRMQV
jgi:flagellar hook-basal body complex protein FliE